MIGVNSLNPSWRFATIYPIPEQVQLVLKHFVTKDYHWFFKYIQQPLHQHYTMWVSMQTAMKCIALIKDAIYRHQFHAISKFIFWVNYTMPPS